VRLSYFLLPQQQQKKKKNLPSLPTLLLLASLAVHAQFTIGRATGGQGAPFFWLNRPYT
jgi:hypothetical protein